MCRHVTEAAPTILRPSGHVKRTRDPTRVSLEEPERPGESVRTGHLESSLHTHVCLNNIDQPDVGDNDVNAVALVVGGVAGVQATVRGPRVVNAQSVLQGGVPHRLLGPALGNMSVKKGKLVHQYPEM